MNDLLGFLSDDNFTVEDQNAIYTPTAPEPNPEPTKELDTPNEGSEGTKPQPSPTEPTPPSNEPTPNQPPAEPTNEPIASPEDSKPASEPLDIDTEKTFRILKETGVIAVEDDFEFTGETDQLGELITQSYDTMKSGARQAVLDELTPEFRELLKYGLTKGQEANLNDFVQRMSATSDLENVDLSQETNQSEIVKQYMKEATAYSDNKIEKQIALWRESGLLETEAKESLTALLALQAEQKQKQEEQFTQAIAERDRMHKESRKQVEELIESANHIDTPRKSKVKAYINNVRQTKGQRPTTEFQRHMQMIGSNAEHSVQLADLIMDMYDPENGFNYDRLNRKKSSQQVSSVREKLDKLINASGPKSGGQPGPSKNSFD